MVPAFDAASSGRIKSGRVFPSSPSSPAPSPAAAAADSDGDKGVVAVGSTGTFAIASLEVGEADEAGGGPLEPFPVVVFVDALLAPVLVLALGGCSAFLSGENVLPFDCLGCGSC